MLSRTQAILALIGMLTVILFTIVKTVQWESKKCKLLSKRETLYIFVCGAIFSIICSGIISAYQAPFGATDPVQEYSSVVSSYELLLDKSAFAMFLSAVIIAPIVEELFFRAYLVTLCHYRFSKSVAVIIGATIFGMFHNGLIQMLYAYFFGMVLGYLYYYVPEYECAGVPAMEVNRDGNVMRPILFHMGFNFAGVILAMLLTL